MTFSGLGIERASVKGPGHRCPGKTGIHSRRSSMERQLARQGRHAFSHAVVAGVLMLSAVPAAALADKPGDHGNGPPGPAGNPNHGPQATPPGHANRPHPNNGVRSHGAPSRSQGQLHGPPARPAPKPAEPPKAHSHPASPARPAAPATREHTNNGAAHQKTTLCHATGSATNPYVEITISDRAVKAHARHQDGRDIIPAPPGGCPTPAAASQE